jgi:NAD(P)-dependent dehydrogenase (short-subunit alcohol dehydrogenase family)
LAAFEEGTATAEEDRTLGTVEESPELKATAGRLAGKVAVVSGAAQGIGQAFCERLANDGASVVLVQHETPCAETLRAVEVAGADAMVHEADVSSGDDAAALGEAVSERFGGADILVNNAAIYPMKAFLEMDYSEWRQMFAVNVDSIFHMCQAFVGGMAEKGWGRVINVGSTSYIAGMANYTHYNATKAAIVGFTRSLAVEFGPQGVTANTIAPSLVRTPTTESGPQADGMFEGFLDEQAIKRTETPSDIAGTLSWLASEDAAFVTGQTILVDGGWQFL